jgi:hypothetical protein
LILSSEVRLPTLTVITAVTVISLIATVPVIFTGFGCRAIAPPVLPILRPTLSVTGLILPTDLILSAGLILATLNIVWVHCVIEVANDVVEALRGSRMCNWNCGHHYDRSSGAEQSSTH